MGSGIGADILIQAENPRAAALFYVDQLGFEVTDLTPTMVSLHGQQINLFIEQGVPIGPVLEIAVRNVEETRRRLLAHGCVVLKEEPLVPRIYLKDPFGLIYNLTAATT